MYGPWAIPCESMVVLFVKHSERCIQDVIHFMILERTHSSVGSSKSDPRNTEFCEPWGGGLVLMLETSKDPVIVQLSLGQMVSGGTSVSSGVGYPATIDWPLSYTRLEWTIQPSTVCTYVFERAITMCSASQSRRKHTCSCINNRTYSPIDPAWMSAPEEASCRHWGTQKRLHLECKSSKPCTNYLGWPART